MELLLLAIPIGIGVYTVSVYNRIKRSNIRIDEAYANIDVALSKRYHVLTQLLEVAKGYAKYERETLIDLVTIRGGMSMDAKVEAVESLNNGYSKVLALSESYPELKADALFRKLQDAAFDAEEHLQAARRLYNSNVSQYNQDIETFPGSLFASSMKAQRKPMFQAPSHEKDTVSINI